VDRAEGNPLFLEELLHHSADGRDDLPMSVQALIQARLGLLPPEQRQVVRAASVFGTQFWTDGVSTDFGALDRKGREQLVRYCLRPAIGNERLSILKDGSIAYRKKHPVDDERMGSCCR